MTKEDFTVKKENPRQAKAVKAGKNTWTDTGEEKDGLDAKIQRTAKVNLQRGQAKMVDVVCSACHKTVQVPGSLPRTSYYRCDGCIG